MTAAEGGNRAHRRRAARTKAARAMAAAEGQQAVLVGLLPGGGEAWRRGEVLLVVPGPAPDDAPVAFREGITRRRLVATAGRCPCGARPGQPHGGAVAVAHEPACPASDELLEAAYRSWKGPRS